jgi:hypothetical protein
MLKSRYDAVFLGKTPWALVHAILWRQRGSDVLVIDDKTLSTVSAGHRWVSALERSALEEIGFKYKINVLKDLESYIKPARLKVHTPKLQWCTGSSVQDNLREFVRKFPVFQTKIIYKAIDNVDLDQDLKNVQTAFWQWFHSFEVREKNTSPFVALDCLWFTEFQKLLSEELLRPYQDPQGGELAQLVTAYSAATSQVIKYNFTSHEAAYMAMRLLSPVWEIDMRWIERELVRELEVKGGHFKEAGIQSWQIWDGKVDAALLDSYEGVIRFDRLLLYGFPPGESTLQCVFNEKVFRSLETCWKSETSDLFIKNRSEITAMTGPTLLGTDIPVMLFEDQPNISILNVLVEEREGAKPDFYRKDAANLAHPFLMQIMNNFSDKESKSLTGIGWDLWLEETKSNLGQFRSVDMHQRRQVDVIDRDNQSTLQEIEYWGPLMTQRFALLGFLTEIVWDLD